MWIINASLWYDACCNHFWMMQMFLLSTEIMSEPQSLYGYFNIPNECLNGYQRDIKLLCFERNIYPFFPTCTVVAGSSLLLSLSLPDASVWRVGMTAPDPRPAFARGCAVCGFRFECQEHVHKHTGKRWSRVSAWAHGEYSVYRIVGS